jgi:hypothetical protein
MADALLFGQPCMMMCEWSSKAGLVAMEYLFYTASALTSLP